MPRKKKRRDRSRDPRASRWTDNPFGPIERDGKEVFNPYPPSQRVRMAKIRKAWGIEDPEKRTREMVKLGLYPESALDKFKD